VAAMFFYFFAGAYFFLFLIAFNILLL
jgi:hypothetical protein